MVRLAAGLASACLGSACATPPGDGAAAIRDADITFLAAEAPPPDGAAWTPITLPDDWSRRRPRVGGSAWYRLRFQVGDDARRDGVLALYVPRVNMVGTPFVNGAPVGRAHRFEEPVTRLWYRPQLYWVPAALLTPGENILHYRIHAYPDSQGGLSEVWIGPGASLERLWRTHVFRQLTAMQITTGVTAMLAVLALAAWVVLRWDAAYGYFGAAATAWTLHGVLVLTQDIPVPAIVWEVLIASSLMWVVVAMMLFALRFAGLRRPWAERAALTYAAVAPLLLWAAGTSQIFVVTNACFVVLLAIGAYEFKILTDVARRSRTVESGLLVAAALLVLSLGVHDFLNRRGAWAFAEPFNMHYGVPVLFAAVFWNLLGQVAAARRAADSLNRELEIRVAAKAEELERSHARLRAAYATEALAGERLRIMRDMHDGVGSQLIAARQLVERGAVDAADVAALLDGCMDDLRLVIDSLEPTEGDLVTVLGNLRYRLTDRLARHGVTLDWRVTELPAQSRLGPSEILQVLRIVQEAFANAVKHSGATTMGLSAALASGGRAIALTVHDDGRGFQPAADPARGRGLGNMRQRAEALGGALSVESAPGHGCTVTLTLPC
jgi:signal transduction histidine kinase